MSSAYFKEMSIFTGVVRYHDLGYLLATNDKDVANNIPHTKIYECNRGQWGTGLLKWSAISISVCHLPSERVITISPNGRVEASGGGYPPQEEQISLAEDLIFREVRGIAKGHAYAVGPARTVYRRDAPNKWTCIKAPKPEISQLMDAGFESIDGFSEKDIYAVGWGGEIWHYDGQLWKQINSPTNLGLFKVRCAGNGEVYAGGQMGILLRGRHEQWEIIEHEVTQENLRGIEWFNGILYVATTKSVYELKKDQLIPIDFGNDAPSTCYHLSAADGIMWSIGAKDVMEFDGKKWSRIIKIEK
ncbi:hypothetical protein THII_1586 [Thioploca ingrica]|uniref:Uncharacterized protein n=1 Tax=Thioploca ingrica TaxID=40754 RepID=A0A090ADF3_9GAMM|nr:hypothetical protein THII_1586 [Thioploca ingrica]